MKSILFSLAVLSAVLLETHCTKDERADEPDPVMPRTPKRPKPVKLPAVSVEVGVEVTGQKSNSGRGYGWGKCKSNKKGKSCDKDIYEYGCHKPISQRVLSSSCRATSNRDSSTIIVYQVYTDHDSTAIQCSLVTDTDNWNGQINLSVGKESEVLYLVYDSYGSTGYFTGSKASVGGYVLGFRVRQKKANTYAYYVATSTNGQSWSLACRSKCPAFNLCTQTQVFRIQTLKLWIGIEQVQTKYYLTTSPDLKVWARRQQVLITEVAGYGWVEIVITQFVVLQEGPTVEDTLYCFLGTRPNSNVVNYYIGRFQNGNFTFEFGPRRLDYGPDGGFYTFADETYVENKAAVTDIVLYTSIRNTYFQQEGFEEFFGSTRYVVGNYHCPGFPLRQYSKTDFDQVIGTVQSTGRTLVTDGRQALSFRGRTFSAHVVVIRDTAHTIEFGVHGNSAGRVTTFGYDHLNQSFFVDRAKSPYPSGKKLSAGLSSYAKKYTLPLTLTQDNLALYIIVDENTVEISYDNGNAWFTALSFSQAGSDINYLKPIGGNIYLHSAEVKIFDKEESNSATAKKKKKS